MQLSLARLPGTRTPPGTTPILAALARRLAPSRLQVQLVLADDARLRRLNREFRRRDRATDVLSFLYDQVPDPAAGGPHAELYVSMQRARAQARARGHGLAAELVLLVLHGLLHLQGHDHERPGDARRMGAAEARHRRWVRRRFGWRLPSMLESRATPARRGARRPRRVGSPSAKRVGSP